MRQRRKLLPRENPARQRIYGRRTRFWLWSRIYPWHVRSWWDPDTSVGIVFPAEMFYTDGGEKSLCVSLRWGYICQKRGILCTAKLCIVTKKQIIIMVHSSWQKKMLFPPYPWVRNEDEAAYEGKERGVPSPWERCSVLLSWSSLRGKRKKRPSDASPLSDHW